MPQNTDTLTFYLPKENHTVLQEACDLLDLSVSDLLRSALFDFLNQNAPDISNKMDALFKR